jgi:hypothetical protein
MITLSQRDSLLVILGLFISKSFESVISCRKLRIKHVLKSKTSPLTSKVNIMKMAERACTDQLTAVVLSTAIVVLVFGLIVLDGATENFHNIINDCIHILMQFLDMFLWTRFNGNVNTMWSFPYVTIHSNQDIFYLILCAWLGLYVFLLSLSFAHLLGGSLCDLVPAIANIDEETCHILNNNNSLNWFISWDWSIAIIQGYLLVCNMYFFKKKDAVDALRITSISNYQVYVLLCLCKTVCGSNCIFYNAQPFSSTLTYYTICSLVVSYIMITKEFSPVDTLLIEISAIKVRFVILSFVITSLICQTNEVIHISE